MTTLKVADLATIVGIREQLAAGDIRQRLDAQGINSADLAKVLRVPRTTARSWLAGERTPRPQAALRLARLLRELDDRQAAS